MEVKKIFKSLAFVLVLGSLYTWADTPPARTVNSETFDYLGNGVTSTVTGPARGLDVNVLNSPSISIPNPLPVSQSGVWTVQQGTPPWSVSQSGSWSTGRTWTLGFATDQVDVTGSSVSVSNFPASFGVTQVTSPWTISGTVTANIGSTNGLALDATLAAFSAKFNSLGQKTMANSAPVVIASDQSAIPASQSGTWTVQQGSPPWSVSQSGTWTTGRTWDLNFANDQVDASGSSVSVSNFPATVAVTQSTSPWVISGAVTQGSPPWSVSQSGTWTTGRTWTLSSGTDSVAAVQSGTWNTLARPTDGTNPITKTFDNDSGAGAEYNLGVSLRKSASGGSVELGTSSDPIRIDPTGTTSQPVTGSLGRTWTLSSGTDSVAAVQSGTWTVQQGTPPWSVSQSGSWTVTANAGTGTFQENVAQINGVTPLMGNGVTGTGSQRITVASDNTPFTVNAAQSGSWTVSATQGTSPWVVSQSTASNLNAQVVGDILQGQADDSSSSKAVKIGAVFNTTQPTISTGRRVDLQATTHGGLIVATGTDAFAVNASQSGTWNINNVSGTVSLPTGAATSANQSTEITSLQLIDDIPSAMNGAFSKGAPAMGQLDDASTTAATEDNVAPVRITAQRAFHVNLRNNAGTEIGTSGNPVRTDPTGTTTQPVAETHSTGQIARNDYSTGNVGTGAYVTIIASTTNATKIILFGDTSGQSVKLATGAAASEVDFMIIPPGGSGSIAISIPASTRISAKALSGVATTGELDLSLLQ